MPLLVAALIGGLIQASVTIVGRILIALGVGFITYTGITILIDGIKSDVITNFQALDSQIVQILAVLQVDTAITMIFSAIAARLILNGLQSGAVKRMVLK